jgi:hypothetical protein
MSNNKNGSSDCNTNSEHGTKGHTGANSSIVTNVEAAANQQSHAEKLIPNQSDFVSPSPKHTRRAQKSPQSVSILKTSKYMTSNGFSALDDQDEVYPAKALTDKTKEMAHSVMNLPTEKPIVITLNPIKEKLKKERPKQNKKKVKWNQPKNRGKPAVACIYPSSGPCKYNGSYSGSSCNKCKQHCPCGAKEAAQQAKPQKTPRKMHSN